jgi:hypothetical protein
VPTPSSMASSTTRTGSISPATACDARAPPSYQRNDRPSCPAGLQCPEAARSLRRYVVARSLAACSAQLGGLLQALTTPQPNARNYPASEAPDPDDIMSEHRATSSRNARATSSESALSPKRARLYAMAIVLTGEAIKDLRHAVGRLA